ncbi:MAG: bacillithiol system redox-active protein YtxJ [Lutibacter sp.]|uniref:bacillithiol system redox-active protein YtxJ n=1 Tax=Lutibacter sp. TaxID=1925666 RepID=UPI00385BAF09
MGFLNSLFNERNERDNNLRINWVPLTEISQLTTLISQSSIKPILIFKHSTRCGVSRMALKSFEKSYDLNDSDLEMYFLDLLTYRNISNEISSQLNVHHQSPQVLVVKNGQLVYHDSHYQISLQKIKKVLDLK